MVRAIILGFLVVSSIFHVEAQDAVDTVKILSGDHIMYGIHYSGGSDTFMPTVLLLHGFPGGFGDVLGIGEAMTGQGINIFTLTLSGISISEGTYGGSSPLDDLNHALDFFFRPDIVRQYKIDTSDFIIGGWSFGGGLSLYKGAHDSRISRIISIAGFNGDAFLAQCEEQPDFRKFMEAIFISYRMRGIVDFIPLHAIDDLQTYHDIFTPVDFANKIAKKPLLLFGGTDDAEVSLVKHIMPYYQAVKARRGDVRFHVYQTGHRFGGHLDRLAADILAWIKKS